jgi:O-acetyl-ADP-ribose deacetylase (regulator of RNase III)
VENVNHCLKALRKTIEAEKFTSVALPKLASGVGGLAWKDVKLLIEKHLGDLPIPIVVYSTYHPGVQAAEKL